MTARTCLLLIDMLLHGHSEIAPQTSGTTSMKMIPHVWTTSLDPAHSLLALGSKCLRQQWPVCQLTWQCLPCNQLSDHICILPDPL